MHKDRQSHSISNTCKTRENMLSSSWNTITVLDFLDLEAQESPRSLQRYCKVMKHKNQVISYAIQSSYMHGDLGFSNLSINIWIQANFLFLHF